MNETFGLFSAPTTSTRYGRVHANAFMARRLLRELHEVAQVSGQKTPSISNSYPYNALPLTLPHHGWLAHRRGYNEDIGVTWRGPLPIELVSMTL
jgi:hypothetical protein